MVAQPQNPAARGCTCIKFISNSAEASTQSARKLFEVPTSAFLAPQVYRPGNISGLKMRIPTQDGLVCEMLFKMRIRPGSSGFMRDIGQEGGDTTFANLLPDFCPCPNLPLSANQAEGGAIKGAFYRPPSALRLSGALS